jgi:hypothetical protein
MARRIQPGSLGRQAQGPKKRTITFNLEDDTADIIAELAGALGISQAEVVDRAVSILASEMTKMAMIMPAWMEDDADV